MIFWRAPNARFLIYTRATDYLHVLKDFFMGASRRENSIAKLEHEICDSFGIRHATCVSQARMAIYLAVKGLIRPGQKVILSPYTIADVINMVLCAGGVPVFADIDRATTNVSAGEIKKLIDAHTGVVMVTHLHGIACEIEKIATLCKEKNIPLIEDAAQAFGGKVNGKRLGTFGDAGIFSFGMYKNVTAFYGGMVITNNERLHQWIRKETQDWPPMPLSTLFAKIKQAIFTDISTAPFLFRTIVYWIFRHGYLHDVRWINRLVTVELDVSRKTHVPKWYFSKLWPFQARMALRQLERLDSNSRKRIAYSKIYHEGLRDFPELIIPPLREEGAHIYNYFPVQYRDRISLVKWLMKSRRDLAIQHLKNCAALPSFAPEYRDCKNAELTAAQTILLPNYPAYGEDQVRKNIAAVRAFFKQRENT